jgi:O-antigen/teichoic acid export membrane protein
MSSVSFKDILKGSSWAVLATVVTRATGLITLPLLARLLEPANLGLYNLVLNTVQTGDNLSRLGADAAMHRNGAQYKTLGTEAVGRLFGVGAWLTIASSSVIALGLWLGRATIAHTWLSEPKIEPWLGLAALAIMLNAIGNPSWFYLIALQAFRTYSIRTSIVTILGSGITLALALFWGLSGALVGLGLAALIHAVCGWWLTLPVLKIAGIRLRSDHFIAESRSILEFGLPFYASNFLSSFVALPLLGYVSRSGGLEQLGYLRVAQSVSQFISFLPAALAPVIISSLSASLVSDRENYRKLKSLHLRILWVLSLLLTVVLCQSLESLVLILFGSSFAAAIFPSRLTLWIATITSLSSILSQYVISTGNTRLIALVQLLGLAVTLVASIYLIPPYHVLGLLCSQGFAAVFTVLAYAKPALRDLSSHDRIALWRLAVLTTLLLPSTLVLPLIVQPNSLGWFISSLGLVGAIVAGLTQVFELSERQATWMVLRQTYEKYLNGWF